MNPRLTLQYCDVVNISATRVNLGAVIGKDRFIFHLTELMEKFVFIGGFGITGFSTKETTMLEDPTFIVMTNAILPGVGKFETGLLYMQCIWKSLKYECKLISFRGIQLQ